MRISRRDTLDENLGLVEIEGESSVFLERMFDFREDLEGDGELRLDVTRMPPWLVRGKGARTRPPSGTRAAPTR